MNFVVITVEGTRKLEHEKDGGAGVVRDGKKEGKCVKNGSKAQCLKITEKKSH